MMPHWISDSVYKCNKKLALNGKFDKKTRQGARSPKPAVAVEYCVRTNLYYEP